MFDIITDISIELDFFFSNLNWTFILTLIFVIYGAQYKEEFIWFRCLTKRHRHFRIWIIGLIGLIFFCVFKFLDTGLTVSYISELLRSLMITMVFNSEIIKKIKFKGK